MRAALLLVLLAGCPDRRAARPEDDLPLPRVVHERAQATVESDGDVISIDVDGTIRRGVRRVTVDELARPGDPAGLPEGCVHAEPRCMRAPFAAFDDDGRLVAGRRGRQYGGRRIVGEVLGADVLHAPARVFAARDASARTLVDVVHETGGAIMVDGEDLALGLDVRDSTGDVQAARDIATLRLDATTDVLRALDAAPHTMPCGDYELILPVHLLVGEGVTVQQLVDAIVTLDLAGVRMIGLGNA